VSCASCTAPREGEHGKATKSTAAAKMALRDTIPNDFVDIATITLDLFGR
jgi:hypothetical protein